MYVNIGFFTRIKSGINIIRSSGRIYKQFKNNVKYLNNYVGGSTIKCPKKKNSRDLRGIM